ncbi:MAG: hypothetical protein GF364_06350 [Candidatus Lokiarchaeota archaeon]|nr:hypothetical protein [Candidatus Lokiarchaeota archaeon]
MSDRNFALYITAPFRADVTIRDSISMHDEYHVKSVNVSAVSGFIR